MANRFATRSQWSFDPTVYPKFDYLVVLPDGFTGTSGAFPFKISDGVTPANRLPFAPGAAQFVLPGGSGGSVDIANVPLPVTSTDLSLETTQQQVLTSLGQFEFDALGNLKTTGSGGGGGTVDQGAAGTDPWLVDTGLVQPTTPADTQPVSATTLPLPTGASTSAKQDTGNTSLASIDGKLTSPLSVSGPLTDAQLRATPVPVSGTISTGGLTDAELRASPVEVDVTASVLPTGASTEATLIETRDFVDFGNAVLGNLYAGVNMGDVRYAIQEVRDKLIVDPATETTLSTLTGKIPASLTVVGTALKVDGSAATQPVSGPLTDSELRASAVPVSAAALPLPTGAATAALQTQPGVDIGDVTVNNAAGASAVNIQDGGNSITVDGTVTVTPPTLTKGTQGATGFSVQNLRDAGRTTFNYYTNGAAAAGTSGTETAITLTESLGTAATSTGVSFTPTSGKTFRITSITLRCTGNAVATAQTTVITLRLNTAGAVITTSTPAIQRWALATQATSLATDRIILNFPEGMDIFGDGTLQWGVTVQSTYTTNAPSYHVNISGYLF